MPDNNVTSAFRQPPAQAEVTSPLSSLLVLGALPTAIGCARSHASNIVYEWGLAPLTDTVELLVSELATNALEACQAMPGPVIPPIRMQLRSDGAVVLIEIWDGSTQLPVLKDASTTADGGRGLMLVDALSARWNWYATPEWGGKVVWCEVG